MKTGDAVILASAAAIAWLLLRGGMPKAAAVSGANFAPKPTAADAGFGALVATWEGWRYYDSGYGRDPAGNIYYQGLRLT